jgi:hypothetical protein
METDGIVDGCNRVSSPEQEDCSWNGRARRVFLSDAEAPSQSASTSFVSLTSLWLIDNQKQNGNTDLAVYFRNPYRVHTFLDTTDLYALRLNLGEKTQRTRDIDLPQWHDALRSHKQCASSALTTTLR